MISFLTATVNYNEIGLPVLLEESTYQGNCFLSLMGLWSLCFAIIVVLLAIGIAYWIDKKHKWFEELSNKYLSYAFAIVWLFGFIVYDIGMYTGEPWSLLGNVPMAILHAFEIFILESDVSTIHDPFHNNVWYMACFSLAHFLAALVSLVFVLRHFGFSIIAALKRKFALSSKETTYIFWGMNDATYLLAKDINNRSSEKDNFRIVVVRTNHDDNNTGAVKNGMERLFNFLSLRNNEMDRLKELNCISLSTYSSLANIDTNTEKDTSSIDLLQKKLRLKSLCQIINKKTVKSIHLFSLSDDETTNIQTVANLRYDKTIQAFAERGKVILYCHARYNSIHRVIEDELAAEKMEVKVVDSSHISVELLKNKPLLHPVRYVDIAKDATVSSPFNALVVGFGEVGMDTVRFLYEFGAFVKYRKRKGAVERSDFHCHVIDPQMNDIAGLFTVNAPSIATTLNGQEQDVPKSLNLYNLDCRSVEFYNRLEEWIKTLNYVVIATGDDETNISLAVRIFRLAIRYRENGLDKFRILVRVRHDENGHIQKIKEHYNRLWAADRNRTDGHLYQCV